MPTNSNRCPDKVREYLDDVYSKDDLISLLWRTASPERRAELLRHVV